MSAQDGLTLHILEAELTDVQTPQTGVFLRVGRMVPSVKLITAKQDGLDHVTALCDLTLQTQFLLQTTKTSDITFLHKAKLAEITHKNYDWTVKPKSSKVI